ncbi:MAG: hypothetical protein JWN48_3810 [Myxococcaceae bacterium]|nr:hypothetical protein [Myxococcaceae bacterium]
MSPTSRPTRKRAATTTDSDAQRAVEARAGFPSRAGSARVRRARAQLAQALWTTRGQRKLPSESELDRALSGVSAEELDWVCELSPLAPLYLLPTRRFVQQLVRSLRALEVTEVLEVAAGDGFLSRCLQRAAPELTVRATDSGAWTSPRARMNEAERRALDSADVPGLRLGESVERLSARRAIERYRPQLVLCSWLPPGNLLDTLVRAPVRYVLELGAGSGVTASAYSWRFAHEFMEGPLEQSARCRLDTRPHKQLHSRATLYFGAQHPEYHEERVRPGDWLHQFKPRRRTDR